MKIYLSGPMTGYPELNFPAFDAMRDRLLSQGHEVVSPADLERNRNVVGYNNQLRDDIAHLVFCEAIFLLKGWEKSYGAKLEKFIAESLHFQVIYE